MGHGDKDVTLLDENWYKAILRVRKGVTLLMEKGNELY